MATALFHVDAFTRTPFAGNPAAVCLLDTATADAAWMQAVAAEMHLSETAFVSLRADGDFDLRWFTPTVEVDLCGHATLASAHVLWETGRVAPLTGIRFHTRSGVLAAARTADGGIELDLPADPAAPTLVVGIEHLGTGTPVATYDNGHQIVVELADEAAVLAAAPRFDRLAATADRVWVVTALADADGVDFVSRSFGPRYGIDEDPVTGSSHCALGPLWGARLGRDALVAHQVSARGGELSVRLARDRVHVGGHAVTVAVGELLA